jgi:amino acid adenylation domain-containing protein
MNDKGIEDIYPLSSLQQGLLFHTVLAPETAAYFEQFHWLYVGPLDAERLRACWRSAVRRHPILRSGFFWRDLDQAFQVVRREVGLEWNRLDWSQLDADHHGRQLEKLLRHDRARGFDLARAPLMRFALVRLAAERHLFVWSYHHLLLDGWSAVALLREIVTLYQAASCGKEADPPPRRPYSDYIAWLKRQDMGRAAQYWQRALAGAVPRGELGIERPERDLGPGEPPYGEARRVLDRRATAALRRLARELRITLNTVVQGAWAIVLARYTGSPDVLFGTVVSGRPAELVGAEAMIGLFVNTLPARAEVSHGAPLGTWLRDLQAKQAEMRSYEYSPLGEIQRWSGLPREVPLISHILAFENHPGGRPHGDAEAVRIESLVHRYAPTGYPLTLIVEPLEELSLIALFDRRRFDEPAVCRLLGHLRNVLAELPADPARRLGELRILGREEEAHLLEMSSGAQRPYPREASIPQLFEAPVRARPDVVAVSFSDHRLSYRELDRRAGRLAGRLRQLGAGRGACVGLVVERSLDLVPAMLAVLKAGAAYLSMDSATPAERMAYLIADAGVELMLYHGSPDSQPPASAARWLRLEDELARATPAGGDRLLPEVDARDLAYVVYTSGSSGRPKGVAVPHRGVATLTLAAEFVGYGPGETFLQLAPTSFDASTFEIWGALLHGGRLAVYPPEPPGLERLGRFLLEQRVTTAWLTADLFHQMVRGQLEGLAGLRQLAAGGDVLGVAEVRRVLDELPGCRLINGYGPTETTVLCCCHQVRSAVLEGPVPIGQPLANVRAQVVDAELQPVPLGLQGELLIGGDGVTRGYLGQPALTAASFVPDPFGGDGERLYRTGDLVRYRGDGCLEFRGRIDRQVKIRGFRVELEEVEAVLGAHPGLSQVAVTVHGYGDTCQLAAYFVPVNGQGAPSAAELRLELRRRLPEYMVPANLIELDRMPMSSSGKIDRNRLPPPGAPVDLGEVRYLAPANDREERIAAVWRELLEVDRVGVLDNFFDLGGNSLLMLRLHRRLEQELGSEVPILKLFDHPNVRVQAELFDPGRRATPAIADDRPLKLESAKSRLRHQLGRRERNRELGR